jgi:hypothetical protein
MRTGQPAAADRIGSKAATMIGLFLITHGSLGESLIQ